ncbi:MAG: alpha-E domain-containing protein [Mailhella sp.]
MPTISSAKANHLFWLGRYAERVFAQLHFLRQYYDLCLDEGKENALLEYCRKLDLGACAPDRDLFLLQHLFNSEPGTLRYCLNCLNDNSIVLREELTTASIAYVNLCVATLKHCDHDKDINITRLQPITDYILSFWGSVLQHVTNPSTLNILFIGKHVEYIDMYFRFDYPFPRLQAEWTNLENRLSQIEYVADKHCRMELSDIFSNRTAYEEKSALLLQYLNSLILV